MDIDNITYKQLFLRTATDESAIEYVRELELLQSSKTNACGTDVKNRKGL